MGAGDLVAGTHPVSPTGSDSGRLEGVGRYVDPRGEQGRGLVAHVGELTRRLQADRVDGEPPGQKS